MANSANATTPEVNLPIKTGNLRLELGSGDCMACARKGGGMLVGTFDQDLDPNLTDQVVLRLCGDCALSGLAVVVVAANKPEDG